MQSLAYDTYGRLLSSTHTRNTIGGSGGPSVVVSSAYNARGYLTQLRSTAANVEVSRWSVLVQDAEQRVVRERLGNGLITERAVSAYSGRLDAIAGGPDNGSGSIASNSIQNDAYVYDSLGNLNSRSQLTASGGQLVENFGYDDLNRLTSSQVIGQNAKSFSYDAIGNLTNRTGVGAYTYPASGPGSVRPHAVASITGTVLGVTNPSFSYDANGNFTAGGGRTVSWTSFNAPSLISKGAVSTSFAYGPEGQRLKQTLSTGTVISYGAAIEKEVTGAVTKVKTYLPRGLGFIEESGTTAVGRYLHKDHLGSVLAVSDDTGMVLERLSYDPWGRRRNPDGSDAPDTLAGITDRTGFTGQEALDAVNLVHMNGRVYDPIVGRFISADPMVGNPSDGQQLNRYAYVLNNPLGFTDPSGYTPVAMPRYDVPLPRMQWESGVGSNGNNEKCDDKCQEERRRREEKAREKAARDAACAAGSMIACRGGGAHGGDVIFGRTSLQSAPITPEEGHGGPPQSLRSWAQLTTGEKVLFGSLAVAIAAPILVEVVPLTFAGAAANGEILVYVSVDAAGVTRYVGITKDFASRAYAHMTQKGISIDAIPGLSGLSRFDAKGVEQVLIEFYGMSKNGGPLLNQINSIARSNPIYQQAVQRGTELLNKIGFPGF